MDQIPNNGTYHSEEKRITNLEEFISDFKKQISNLLGFEKELSGEIIEKSLLEKLAPLQEDTYYNLLPNLFNIIIDSYIKKKHEKVETYFIPLEVCYKIFLKFDFRIISINTIEKLIGALQWSIIEPQWIDYNFIMDYYATLHQKVPLELKRKTWNLVELTRIKQQELQKKF